MNVLVKVWTCPVLRCRLNFEFYILLKWETFFLRCNLTAVVADLVILTLWESLRSEALTPARGVWMYSFILTRLFGVKMQLRKETIQPWVKHALLKRVMISHSLKFRVFIPIAGISKKTFIYFQSLQSNAFFRMILWINCYGFPPMQCFVIRSQFLTAITSDGPIERKLKKKWNKKIGDRLFGSSFCLSPPINGG